MEFPKINQILFRNLRRKYNNRWSNSLFKPKFIVVGFEALQHGVASFARVRHLLGWNGTKSNVWMPFAPNGETIRSYWHLRNVRTLWLWWRTAPRGSCNRCAGSPRGIDCWRPPSNEAFPWNNGHSTWQRRHRRNFHFVLAPIVLKVWKNKNNDRRSGQATPFSQSHLRALSSSFDKCCVRFSTYAGIVPAWQRSQRRPAQQRMPNQRRRSVPSFCAHLFFCPAKELIQREMHSEQCHAHSVGLHFNRIAKWVGKNSYNKNPFASFQWCLVGFKCI